MKWMVLAMLAALTIPASARSVYEARPNDPAAQYVAPGSNDTATLQAAIDAVQAKSKLGIVFLAPGRYVLKDTVYIWPGIRLIGYGANRPVLSLAAATPGFAGPEKVLLFFAGDRPAAGQPVPDANPGTFYSALSNIDIEIGEGNPGAVAIRSKYAQHSFIAHSEMRLGSALAGIHESGNVIEDVRFIGGRYGLWTGQPSPGWQLTVIDSVFEGQREAAIREHDAGLTLIRPVFRHVPAAVALEPDTVHELWVSDAVLEDISGPAFAFGMEKTARNQISMERIACRAVPVFVAMTDSGRKFAAPAADYVVKRFSHGLTFADAAAAPTMATSFDAAPGTVAAPVSDLKAIPPMADWFNVREAGARGDGKTDDTAALQKAIAGHRVLYFPSGIYMVGATLALKSDTVLIGLHPAVTQILLPDATPAFAGVGPLKPLIETPAGGTNILAGLGVYTSGNNPRAAGVLWRSGTQSFINDVRFLGGHGTPRSAASAPPPPMFANYPYDYPYNANHSADPDPARRWDSQYPSLMVTGGGTFLDIWTPSTFAEAGMVVADSTTPGRVYQLSVEHHVRHEVQVRNSAQWQFYALQTEEERGESGHALPLEVIGSEDILFANTFAYRVISADQPAPMQVKVSGSRDIRFRNLHNYSNSKVIFDASVVDTDRGVTVYDRELAVLDINPGPQAAPLDKRLTKLADGFANVSGAAAGPDGALYFIDTQRQTLYRWNGHLENVADAPLAPVNLAVDGAGNVMAVSYHDEGVVYALAPDRTMKVLAPRSRPAGARYLLPSGSWTLDRTMLGKPIAWFVSPDGTLSWPAAADFLEGHMSWGIKMAPQYRAFQFAAAKPGSTVYLSEELETRTYAAEVGADGRLMGWRLFAERGGEAAVSDAAGNVYIADGNVYVYDAAGKHTDTIVMPEHATGLVFSKDGKTLFVPTRTALYAVRR